MTLCGDWVLYIINCYSSTLVEDLTNVPYTETVWCILMSKMLILISVRYYATSATAVNEIVPHNTIRKAGSMSDYVIICGEFNHSSIDWNTLHIGSESQGFLDLVLTVFWILHIKEPS